MLMAEVTIEARPNGPYIVNGSIELRDTNGNILPTETRTVLLRCVDEKAVLRRNPFEDRLQAAAQVVPESTEKS
jgi:hypothetical protein